MKIFAKPRVIRGTQGKSLPLLPSGPGGVRDRLLHGARNLTNFTLPDVYNGGNMPLLTLLFFLFAAAPEQEIRKVLADQQEAWNRGDIDTFMHGYSDSPETAFIGKDVTKGYAGVLNNYHKRYPTNDAMGKLEFTILEVRMLGERNAAVVGRFELTRTAAGGGRAAGIFSLVFEKGSGGWKIILDHTS